MPLPPPPERPGGLASPAVLAIVFVLLTLVGAGLGYVLFIGLPSGAPAQPVDTAPPKPVWVAGTGPLVEGVSLPGEAPELLRWSPDGREVGWIALDRGGMQRVATTVPITDRFGEFTTHKVAPDWLSGGTTDQTYVASVQHGVVLVAGPGAPDGRVVDVLGQLGLNQPSAPAIYHRGGRIWLALVGHRGAPGAPYSLHVVEITRLFAQP